MFPIRENVPCLTTEQMVEVDRAMIEDYGIELIQMMENAGRHLAHLSRVRFLDGDPTGKRVVVMCGTGGNGGGAMVCARRLAGWGAVVRVVTTADDRAFRGAPAQQLRALRAMGVAVGNASGRAPDTDLIVDGIIGYNLRGAPRGAAKSLIDSANEHPAPVLSLDVPSGVDAGSGTVSDPAIRATATLTLALPKVGLLDDGAHAHVGELYLADIGVPPELYQRAALGLTASGRFADRVRALFAESEIVHVGPNGSTSAAL